ncbi:reverse transcriptase domain-containing protein [Patiriisocius hiemis]|uniref:RNA-directed DNA polymerase n=1 Tax=Patiriisocius hiemis TaxID=3075604 RepID=A0ABU2YF25_9FLAO|nr:reverse transcriptase domain-containing protein [Constantimarinum sp. W242]MDT0556793.1 reverse transcriptase domain-containing protein [Constantimarinum sp. W242]
MAKDFLQISTKQELAIYLGISKKKLLYNAYKTDLRYNSFTINKKNGRQREISSPIPSLKNIQKQISLELNKHYRPKKQVHSFIKKRGIKTNAKKHIKKKFVLNMDLADFFSTINFGRVRGVFLNYPFFFNEEIATILAQLCCHNNKLPQGSPVSPVISNIICRSLDKELVVFSKKNQCYYTRYADDITLSTNLKKFPSNVAELSNNEVYLSDSLIRIINNNGFTVNKEKTSIRSHYEHQYVTGLTVNRKVNVKRKILKRVRAMLYAWEKFGLNNAAEEHFTKYSKKHKLKKDYSLFIRIVEGYLFFIKDIRGHDDLLFRSLVKKYNKLSSNSVLKNILLHQGEKILVYTEGNTDWMHLKASLLELSKIDIGLNSLSNMIKFVEYDPNYAVGDLKLVNILEGILVSKSKKPVIAIFDSDNLQKIGEFGSKRQKRYNIFNNTVYTFSLPKPFHRSTNLNCIEHFYYDKDLLKKDEFGRRLYLSDEFDSQNGKFIQDDKIRCFASLKKLQKKEFIIDSMVKNDDNDSLALTKKDFALNIYNTTDEFKNINYSNFKLIFSLIQDIIKYHQLVNK